MEQIKKNQSSVEWLFEQVCNLDWRNISGEEKLKTFEQAKSIHKEEVIDAVGVGSQFDRDYLYGYHDKAEQYYNETFGGNNEQQ